MSTSEYLTPAQVAEIVHVPTATVEYWLSIKRLRSLKPGRHRIIKRADLEAFLESTASTPAPRKAAARRGGKAA